MTRDKYEVLKLGIFENYFIASPRLLLLVGCILEGFNFLVYALLKYFNASDSHSVLAGAVAFFVGFPLLNFPPSAFVSYGENLKKSCCPNRISTAFRHLPSTLRYDYL